ncbi:MAG: type II secretion system protein [Cetobacterium sp.]
MKNKKRAFSVIEIVLVLGVIGILSSFIAPKVRDYLAMAKDSKAINTLQSLRMASETYYLENGNYPWGENNKIEEEVLTKLEKYTGKKIGISESEPFLEIGGSKNSEKDSEIKYGGKVEVKINSERGFLLEPTESTLKFNIRGEEWSSI